MCFFANWQGYQLPICRYTASAARRTSTLWQPQGKLPVEHPYVVMQREVLKQNPKKKSFLLTPRLIECKAPVWYCHTPQLCCKHRSPDVLVFVFANWQGDHLPTSAPPWACASACTMGKPHGTLAAGYRSHLKHWLEPKWLEPKWLEPKWLRY